MKNWKRIVKRVIVESLALALLIVLGIMIENQYVKWNSERDTNSVYGTTEACCPEDEWVSFDSLSDGEKWDWYINTVLEKDLYGYIDEEVTLRILCCEKYENGITIHYDVLTSEGEDLNLSGFRYIKYPDKIHK